LPQHQNKRESTLTKEKKQGIAATVIVHLLFAIFLVFMSFKVKPTMPVEVEEGLLVNFGFDQTGEGLFEPAPVAEASPSPPAAAEAVEDDAVLTQDFEEAPVVKKKEPTAEELKRREEAAAERKRIEQENAERIRREEEQRRLNQINDRTKNAFGNAGNVGESGTSEGIAGGEGNQGVETGTVGVRNYGPGGGTGNGTISYSLGERKFQSLPIPKYDYQGEGIVAVEISVDRNGNVTKAVAGVKGSTTLDEYLCREAREAAMKAKFDSSDNAPLLQKGRIYYNFKLR
jgi:colicin import membrane protein